ncbi:MAG: glycosyltransferase family 2 protein [Planctomycetota bacterium]|jgi:glycosyltransferase involved in cell wall biosynthesis
MAANTQANPSIGPEEKKVLKYSAVIPVFNSEHIVGTTIDRTVDFFERHRLDYEIILVNDGSRDSSWSVVCRKASASPKIVAIDLLRNYGQHTANFCGFQHAAGDYVITLDDDMQNPPEEIIHLIDKAKEGYDVVLGHFKKKEHSLFRRWGSRLIGFVNRRIFLHHEGLVLSNFRIIRRDVVDRICAYKTCYPYITGLVLMFSSSPANVPVEHRERAVGKGHYSMGRIVRLVMRILFNYSSYPLRLVTIFGLIVSAISFLLGTYYLGRGLLKTVPVPGWTTLAVLVSFFNGITLLLLGMLGEYLIRMVNQTSAGAPYHIKGIIRSNGSPHKT